MGEGYLWWTWKPRVEVGYRLKFGTEDDSSLRAYLASAYHSTTICTRLTYLQQSTSQFRTIRCHAASQLDRRTSMAPHGALPVQGPGCGQPRKPWNKPPDDSRTSASRPQRCGVRGRFCTVRSSPQSTLAWDYLYGASDRGQLTSNAVHHPMDTTEENQGRLSSGQRLEVCPPSPTRQSVVGLPEVGRG